ncbi:aminopeptidase [Deinococcus maricopensis]|nr:aminopeptidase [Deinococcus maricopensis]
MIYNPEKHADLLVDYCVYVKPGERILVHGSTLALPLLEALHRALLTRGARPVLRLEYPEQADDFVRLASDEVLDAVHAADLADMEAIDGSIRVLAARALASDVDPARRSRLMKAAAPLAGARSRRKWTLTQYPALADAQAAGMSEEEYAAFVARAMFLDHADPVAQWAEVRAMQARLIERLTVADEVRIVGPGTDLRLSVRGRTWANSDGKRNMPSGEVFTGPLEDSAQGVITFDLPTVFQGARVRGIRLEFRDGKVVDATAEEGEAALLAALDTDEGARFLGELGIGTNFGIQVPTQNILFDEKIGGTVHLAVGKSYPETGGVNASALHWDMICDLRSGGQILLDGEVFQENGRFVQ